MTIIRLSLLLASTALLVLPAAAQTVYSPGQVTRYGGTTIITPSYGQQSYGMQQPYPQQQQIYGTQQQQTGVNGTGVPTAGQPNVTIPNQSQSAVDDVMSLGRAKATTATAKPASSVIGSGASSATKDPRGKRFAGGAVVVDGNTLVLSGTDVIVLNGADAPEVDQVCGDPRGFGWNCGTKSKDRLIELIGNQAVVCVGVAAANGGTAATCHVGKTDLGQQMVLEGLAVVPRAVAPAYLAEESEARAAKRGVWSGTFKAPWLVRAGK